MPVVERYQLAPGYTISRVIKGGWQLAGGHGAFDREQALEDMRAYVQAGITTFDCADIYTGVEALIGEFLHREGAAIREGALQAVQVHTKYVPDLGSLSALTKKDVEASIDRSLRRLEMERLDLVQFHWWDFDVPFYVEAAGWLAELQSAGKIRHIGLTNFDVPRMAEIVDAGVPVVSNQVQFSVLDQRPAADMVAFCQRQGVTLLCYGTVAGGFLSSRYLGVSPPAEPMENRSLTKYRLIIDEFGGWSLFQGLLQVLDAVAAKYGVDIAVVATRYVLQQPGAAAAIVGARNARHLADTRNLFSLELDHHDLRAIDDVLRQATGPQGPVYGLEREKEGRHAAIMKYNLNRPTRQ